VSSPLLLLQRFSRLECAVSREFRSLRTTSIPLHPSSSRLTDSPSPLLPSWVSFTGGHVSSSLFTARILPGGQDSQHLLPSHHPTAPLSARVDTRYLLETDDGVYIEVRTRGWRTGKKEVLERLSNAAKEGAEDSVPGPEEYKFRLSIEMEVSHFLGARRG